MIVRESVTEKTDMRSITPFLKWAGGKRWLVPELPRLIPAYIGTYFEPFLGSGAAFFSLRPHRAVLSDSNAELIDVYFTIAREAKEVSRLLRFHHRQHCEQHYYKVRASKPRRMATKAARFIYLNRVCWNGLYRVNKQGEFNVPIGTKTSVILDSDDFEAVAKLLLGKKLLCRAQSTLDEPFSIDLKCVKVCQPIGDFYIAAIDAATLIQITFSDVRHMVEREVDMYLGIQREVDKKRVADIAKYVNTRDACFPTAVILAVDGQCAEYDDARGVLTLKAVLNPDEGQSRINKIQIAKVLDGQHRIEGLRDLGAENRPFDVNVSIFVEMDAESQAYLFSKVNLAQTKVKKSLVYDLFDYAHSRSPQKTCHNLAVALDSTDRSPFYQKIKRLGVATDGRFGETLTQSTFVEALLPYLSSDPVKDRDIYLRGHTPKHADADELVDLIFRNMFIDEKDVDIGRVLFNFFEAARKRWEEAWNRGGKGFILNRTNGFRALMRVLKPAYLYYTVPGGVPSMDEFFSLFEKCRLQDGDFNTDNYKPGTSGETKLFYDIATDMEII